MPKVDIDLVIKSAFNDAPIIQNDGSILFPANGPDEQAARILSGIEECAKSPQDNPNAGILASYLIEILRINENWQSANSIIRSAKIAYTNHKNTSNNDILKSISDFHSAHATILENLDELETAIKNFRISLQLSELIDPQSIDTITSINNLANALETNGNIDEAKELYTTGLYKLRSIDEEYSEIGSIIHNNLAYINKTQGNFVEARDHYTKALSFILNNTDNDFTKVVTLFNAGRNEMEISEKKLARDYFVKAKGIAVNILPPDHELLEAIESELKAI